MDTILIRFFQATLTFLSPTLKGLFVVDIHVIWFIRAWFKRFFSAQILWKNKGLEYWKKEGWCFLISHLTNIQVFHWVGAVERKQCENCVLFFFIFSKAIKAKMNKGYFRVSSTGFQQKKLRVPSTGHFEKAPTNQITCIWHVETQAEKQGHRASSQDTSKNNCRSKPWLYFCRKQPLYNQKS